MSAATTNKIPLRSEQKPEDCWDLDPLFASREEWEAEFSRLDSLIAPALALPGKLKSPEKVAAVFAAEDALSLSIERLYTYAHHRQSEDTGDAASQTRMRRIEARLARIKGETAWIEPEILEQSLETLEKWRKTAALKSYRRTLTQIIRHKPHVLSGKEETLLSLASDIFGKPYETFTCLTNADLKFPAVKDEKGVSQPLSQGRFIVFLENRDRSVRKRAFNTFNNVFGQFRNTLASTLGAAVRTQNYNAKIRNYSSALEAALHPDHIPVRLYESLIEAVHQALPIFHEYVDLRAKALGLKQLDMFDQHVPIVPNFEMKMSWSDAKKAVLKSIAPMGPDYIRRVESAFKSRWVDIYENKGKRSGAFSGGCFGAPSYILMNYQDQLDGVFTLAHEMGHSMHSTLSNEANPYRYAQYSIFVAEIASTVNETLLMRSLLSKAKDPSLRAFLLNHLCDDFRKTVFRQAMFAEFEKMLHEMDARGEPVTADSCAEAYYNLNALHYGPKVRADRKISLEWLRIPHFYYNFYVYKYATGFCAAQIFAQKISESEEARDRYLEMLRAGGSDDPLEIVRRAGVDLTDPAVLLDAFASFRRAIHELKDLIGK